jgi:hypothetical protein
MGYYVAPFSALFTSNRTLRCDWISAKSERQALASMQHRRERFVLKMEQGVWIFGQSSGKYQELAWTGLTPQKITPSICGIRE